MTEKNLWRSSLIAAAYSFQQEAGPYLELLKSTESHINPRPGERWLDLGCGSGRLIRSIWEKAHGQVRCIVGIDVSYTGLGYTKRSLKSLLPKIFPQTIHLIRADFAEGIGNLFRAGIFDGVTAGLSISYAEHWNPVTKNWDNHAYMQLLRDIFALLRDGGSFIFSSNVPNYNFSLLALKSWRQIFLTWKMPLALAVTSIMLAQSFWLRDCARKGRFHYLPADDIVRCLYAVGFKKVQYELTYARQAWVFVAIK